MESALTRQQVLFFPRWSDMGRHQVAVFYHSYHIVALVKVFDFAHVRLFVLLLLSP